MHRGEFFRHEYKHKPDDENTRQYNSGILGGISEAQWQAFTIEEEFSGCRLSSSTSIPDTSLCPPLADILLPDQQQWRDATGTKCNKGYSESDSTALDVQKILDIELLRIFLKYEAENAMRPVGVTANKKYWNFCAALIGRSLKNDMKGKLGESDGGKGAQDGNKIENDPSSKPDRNSMVKDSTGKEAQSDSNGRSEDDQENNSYKVEQKELKPGSQAGESWPLLMSIMQLDIVPSQACASIQNSSTGLSKFSYIF